MICYAYYMSNHLNSLDLITVTIEMKATNYYNSYVRRGGGYSYVKCRVPWSLLLQPIPVSIISVLLKNGGTNVRQAAATSWLSEGIHITIVSHVVKGMNFPTLISVAETMKSPRYPNTGLHFTYHQFQETYGTMVQRLPQAKNQAKYIKNNSSLAVRNDCMVLFRRPSKFARVHVNAWGENKFNLT
jgi:hypothetical protein